MTAVQVSDLWFSYEVAENIGATAVEIDKGKRLCDGGLSLENPRKQHEKNTKLVQKLQLMRRESQPVIRLNLSRLRRLQLVRLSGGLAGSVLSCVKPSLQQHRCRLSNHHQRCNRSVSVRFQLHLCRA